MFYFHDLQLWERATGGSSKKKKPFLDLTASRVVRGPESYYTMWNSMGATSSSISGTSMDDPDGQVIEVAYRVAEIAKVRFVDASCCMPHPVARALALFSFAEEY